MLAQIFLAFQFLAAPSDRVRAAETQQKILMDASKQHERDVRARQEHQKRQFEVKFNQLIDAVSSFAKQYNERKGQTWPMREAEKLREAMRQLQSIEESLRVDRVTASKYRKRPSTMVPAR